MPTKKATAITPDKKGRWPLEFLRNQKQNLESKQNEFETLNRRSVSNSRNNENITSVGGNEGDCAQAAMYTEVNRISAECSAEIIADIDTALAILSRDLKSAGKHQYGICENCSTSISSLRLENAPWARLCVHCQQTKEEKTKESYTSPGVETNTRGGIHKSRSVTPGVIRGRV